MQRSKSVIRVLVLVVILIMCVIQMTGCSEEVPNATSAEAGLYLLGDIIVGVDGKKVIENGKEVYALASNGDIISLDDKRIIVSAYNVQDFSCISKAKLVEEDALNVTVSVIPISRGESVYEYDTYKLEFEIAPDDVINKQIIVKTSDTNIVNFGGEEEVTSAENDSSGMAEIEFNACFAGSVKLTLYNCLGKVLNTVTVNVQEKTVRDFATIRETRQLVAHCNHEFKDIEIEVTGTSESTTLHKCTKCGLTTSTDYTKNEACDHHYVTKVISPTYSSKGYTLHTCTLCGDSYKDHYTARLTRSSTSKPASNNTPATSKPVDTPEPTQEPMPTSKPTDAPEETLVIEPKPTPTMVPVSDIID